MTYEQLKEQAKVGQQTIEDGKTWKILSQSLLRGSVWTVTIAGFIILFLRIMVVVNKPYTNLFKKLNGPN